MLLRRVSPPPATTSLPRRLLATLWRWLALYPGRVLVATLVLAFIVTHIPPLTEPTHDPVDRLIGRDKLFHLVGFTVISWLVMNWLIRHRPPLAAALLTFIFCAVYGAFDELTQPAFGRGAEWGDWYANLIGTLIGMTIYALGPKPPSPQRPPTGAGTEQDDRSRAH